MTNDAAPSSFPMLEALNRLGRHIYAGTVHPRTVARRRAANKLARASRRANRKG